MNWSNVKLILYREVRDQLRDRRTMFMIAVLPLLLYPLLGMSFFQVAQFMREHASQVLVLGQWESQGIPPLIENGSISPSLFKEPQRAKLVEATVNPIEIVPEDATSGAELDGELAEKAANLVRDGEYEVVVLFPHDFPERLTAFREQLLMRRSEAVATGTPAPAAIDKDLAVPEPRIFHNTAKEKSQIAQARLSEVLRAWREKIVEKSLEDSQLPQSTARPFEFEESDVADQGHRDAALWSKILPFVLLIWALTGAFYPAIDLCAGEKERGTLETLLSSPAERSEIVTGKLLTIMAFSIATSVLNLASMGLTGSFVIKQLGSIDPTTQGVGMPPLLAILWLLVALVPTSALFSALCLALAAFARSTKEGQYYLMPLLLVTMPLMILPMAPGVEMTLGNSFIPVTGVVLLLRMLLEGNYVGAAPYVVPVVVVTGLCCLLAMRWAIEQFNTESVLFRESERLDVGLWLRHLMVDRGDTPSAAEGVFCALLILIIMFFMSFALPAPNDFRDFVNLIAVTQLAVIATPALLMTVMLTRSPRKTLLLYFPKLLTIPASILLAIALHPAFKFLQMRIHELYPINQDLSQLGKFAEGAALWQLVLVMALFPAICEELAFRGFILSGLRQTGHKWRAIIISSLFFGFTHTLFQQSLITSLIGVLIAYIAVQTGSILPGILFHLTHNSLLLMAAQAVEDGRYESLYFRIGEQDFGYHWYVVVAGVIVGVALLTYFRRLKVLPADQQAITPTEDGSQQRRMAG